MSILHREERWEEQKIKRFSLRFGVETHGTLEYEQCHAGLVSFHPELHTT
jgi:hypothetical protein